MVIVEVKNKEDFVGWMSKVDRKRYMMILTTSGKVVLKPSVTSRNLYTVVLFNANKQMQDELANDWGEVLRCNELYFSDEVKFL